MIKPTGLLHLNLHVASIDRSRHFYQQVFGYILISEVSREIVEVMIDGQSVAMKQIVMGIPGANDLLALTELAGQQVVIGMGHFGIVVEDEKVAALAEKATTYGGTILHKGVRKRNAIRESFSYINDPDGYAIEISSYATVYDQDCRQSATVK